MELSGRDRFLVFLLNDASSMSMSEKIILRTSACH
jgi:hypothetical protein